MKKQIRKNSKFATWVLICTLVMGLILTVEINAQKKAKPAQTPKIYWYADFTVTIKGKGEKRSEGGDSIIKWSFDRTYSAVIKLDMSLPVPPPDKKISPQEMIEAFKTGRFTTYENDTSKQDVTFTTPMKVTIKDVLDVTTKEKGEGGSFENSLATTNWTADAATTALGSLALSTDGKLLTYNVFIPILFMKNPDNKELTIQSQTIYDRSSFGYGDAPTHEETPVKEILAPLGSIKIPDVTGLIKSAAVKHTTDRPFPANFFTAWEYDSGDMTPDQPLIQGVPDSKTNVKVRVRYRFSKTPLY